MRPGLLLVGALVSGAPTRPGRWQAVPEALCILTTAACADGSSNRGRSIKRRIDDAAGL